MVMGTGCRTKVRWREGVGSLGVVEMNVFFSLQALRTTAPHVELLPKRCADLRGLGKSKTQRKSDAARSVPGKMP